MVQLMLSGGSRKSCTAIFPRIGIYAIHTLHSITRRQVRTYLYLKPVDDLPVDDAGYRRGVPILFWCSSLEELLALLRTPKTGVSKNQSAVVDE